MIKSAVLYLLSIYFNAHSGTQWLKYPWIHKDISVHFFIDISDNCILHLSRFLYSICFFFFLSKILFTYSEIYSKV